MSKNASTPNFPEKPVNAGSEKLPSVPREIRVLVAAAFVVALGFGLIAPILPQFATSFNVGVAAASVIVSIFAFARLIFAPVSGKLTDWLGEPTVYVTGVLIVAASTILCGFAQSYTQLLIFRGLGGLGSTMFTVSAMALIARMSPPQIRGRIAGLYSGSFLLGNVAGPVLGSLAAGMGFRIPFFIYGGALVVAASIVYFSLSHSRRATMKTAAEKAAPTVDRIPLSEAWGAASFKAALVSGFTNGWMAFGVRMSLIPLFAVAAFASQGTLLAGLALAIFAVGNGAALTVAGRLTDTYGRRLPILVGLTVASLATAAIGWVDTIPLFIALSVIGGLGTGLMGPAQQAAIADVVGQGRNGGKVMATFQMATDFGSIIGPILAGLIADRAGFGWAFTVSGALGLMGVIAWLPVKEKRPAAATDSSRAISEPGPFRDGLDDRQ
ncbi:MFS transporter [Paeniglutamicibacter sulfureus]|uniref:MFS family permease n=1 Tax=Paeniglutamicibacter sulfureus TaxID=43666 RepID=A0ABU2BP50_9MICC|nr:MFS transporter [Paeniglutamicibacter sulfureus]MDR7360428.1 MFS family permease [Paeniglutamicibacter sulfureus]